VETAEKVVVCAAARESRREIGKRVNCILNRLCKEFLENEGQERLKGFCV
jgi:hypothetical protein